MSLLPSLALSFNIYIYFQQMMAEPSHLNIEDLAAPLRQSFVKKDLEDFIRASHLMHGAAEVLGDFISYCKFDSS